MKLPMFALAAAPLLLLGADQPTPENKYDKEAKTQPAATEAEPSAQDKETLAKLHHDNEMEIKLGKLAKQNGHSKQVKSFGDRLVKDHTLADKEITSYAKKAKIDLTLPAPKDPAEKAQHEAKLDAVKRLETLKGDEFDREFAKMMVDDHQKAVTMTETTIAATQNTKIHALLTKLLPVLKDHLRLAEDIQKALQNV